MGRLQRLGSAIANVLGALAVVCFSCAGAGASEMSIAGNGLWLRGHIVPGDQVKFRELIDNAVQGRIAVVHLDSPGGDIYTAGEIARQIRSAGMTTVVDASRDICASSRAVIFAGGVKRVYLHAGRVGGLSTGRGFKGSSFHEAVVSDLAGGGSLNGEATAVMVARFRELGAPDAAELVDYAPPCAIYGLSGPMALELGIATTL